MSEFWLCFNCCIAEQPQPKRRRRIDRSMIGEPTNFVHTAHVGSGDVFSGMNSFYPKPNAVKGRLWWQHVCECPDAACRYKSRITLVLPGSSGWFLASPSFCLYHLHFALVTAFCVLHCVQDDASVLPQENNDGLCQRSY